MLVLTTGGAAYAASDPTSPTSPTGPSASANPTPAADPTGTPSPTGSTPSDEAETGGPSGTQVVPQQRSAPAAAQAVASSEVKVIKETDLGAKPLQPGTEFKYIITVQCSGLTVGCVNQSLVDVLPESLDITSLPSATGGRSVDFDAATRELTIAFTEALQSPPGELGLNDGATRVIEIGVRLPADTDLLDGAQIPNTATTVADNAEPSSSTTTVEVDVPRVVRPVATKTWRDGAAIAGSGEDTTVVIGVRNGSTGGPIIEELSVTDDAAATFDRFDLTALALTRLPAGADTAEVQVCRDAVGQCAAGDYTTVDTRTSPGDFTVPTPATVTGFRVVFTDSQGDPLPFDSTGGAVEADLRLRDTIRSTGADLKPTTRQTVQNCAVPGAVDDLGAATSGDPACDTFDILPDTILIGASKQFFADTDGDWTKETGEYAVVGEHSPVTATVQAKNNSPFPLRTIIITEPDAGADPANVEFDALDVTTARLRFPSGATSAQLVVTYDSGLPRTFDQTATATIDVTSPGRRVTGLTVTYTGVDAEGSPSIAEGATAFLDVHGTLNDTVDAADLPGGASAGVPNCAGWEARADTSSSTGTASGSTCATLQVEQRRVSGTGTKNVSQTSLPEGQPIDFSLRLSNNGNVPLVGAILSDPPVDAGGAPRTHNNPFDIVRLVSAGVSSDPAGLRTALEVYDPDAGDWVAYAAGNTALLTRATGVRVRVLDELDPTKRVDLRLTVQRREGIPDGRTLDNCFQSGAQDWVGFAGDVCSAGVQTGPANGGAVINKRIEPSTLPEQVPGVPKQTAKVTLTIANTGNVSATRMVLTDEDLDPSAPSAVRDFWDSVDFGQVSSVQFPVGANRVQLDALTADGWVTGTPDGSAPWELPSGVAPDEVIGVRATFTNSAGGYALRPCEGAPTPDACTGKVVLDVHPRQSRRSDGQPVGRVTLTDTASGGYETRLEAPTTLRPIAPVESTLAFVSGAPQLAVQKDPNSSIAPGEVAPFELKVTNTGTSNLPALVVEDQIPAGLTFDETFAGDGGQPYKLVNTQVPAGTEPVPAPTFTAIRTDGRVTGLRWEFGPSWMMRPGATLTLQVQMMLSPGVVEGQLNTNLMGATSSATGLACAPGSGTDAGPFGGGTWCTDTAVVTTKAGAAFQARKWVAGTDTLGWWDNRNLRTVPVGDPACPARTEAGRTYTAFPCVALVNPGDRYDYLLTFVNAGTEPATSMRVIDRFPVVGDKGVVLSRTDRGTQWDARPRLATEPQLIGAGALTTTYAASEPLCTSDLSMTDTCAGGSWSAPFGPDAVGAQMRVRWDTPLAPGAGVAIAFSMDTPLDVTRVADPTIAWNSFGHAETTRRGDGSTRTLPPTEPIQVGVALAYGTLRVSKQVTDNPGGLPVSGLEFRFAYSCTIDPVGNPRQTVAEGTLTLRDGESEDVTGIPAGARCEVWETDAQGGVSDHPENDPAVVTITPQLGTQTAVSAVRITNAFPLVPLTVTKAVTGAAAAYGQQTTYPVEVLCTFGGSPVTGFPTTVQLTGNDTETLDAPAGALCTARELDDGGATSTVVAPTAGVVLTPGSSTPLELKVTNTFDAGHLQIVKQITGAGASLPDGPFVFEVTCDFEGTPLDPITVTLERSAAETELTGDVPGILPIGAVCDVRETDTGGADAIPAPVTVTIVKNADNDTVTATFTNQFSAGTVALTKELAGAGATASYATGASFTVLVTCAVGDATHVVHSEPVRIKGGERRELVDADGDPVLLPLGTRCWAEETATGGATSHASTAGSFTDGVEVVSGTPDDLQQLELGVTNTFDLTSVALVKQVDGAAAAYAAGRQYTVAVTCVLPQDGTMTPLVTAKPFQVSAGQTITVPDLPVGAQCWAQETDTGGATMTTVSHPSAAQPLTATATGTDRITVSNTFAAGTLTVKKKVVGGPAGPYSFQLQCTTALGPVALAAGDAAFKLRAGRTRTISVPLGAACEVKEVRVPKAAKASYQDTTGTGRAKRDGRVVVSPKASVTVTNTFAEGGAVGGAGAGDDRGVRGGGVSLPNTGGPSGWLLGAGLALLLAGAGALLVARRRRS